ncbi:MAG: SlyX family protein [Alphaproteobacteria bacterium]|nr:SlyX family protein [Alphaproteobacteria bacterium]
MDQIADLQMRLMDQEKQLGEMNEELVRLNKLLAQLLRDYKSLKETVDLSPVKPQSEETPPPHY